MDPTFQMNSGTFGPPFRIQCSHNIEKLGYSDEKQKQYSLIGFAPPSGRPPFSVLLKNENNAEN